MTEACEECIGRSWLLERLAGHLDLVRARIGELLCLEDGELVEAVGGSERRTVCRELARIDCTAYRARAEAAGLELVCRCAASYPASVAALSNPPAVLHVAGGLDRFTELAAGDPVAIVGARKASEYGREVAEALASALGTSGVSVVSGMAVGIDTAAHRGALATGGGTIAVLPGGADRPYPAGSRALRRRIAAAGAVVSELPPGMAPRRWTFPARNRIIAALGSMTVVVEAGIRSGALVTARVAAGLGRTLGAVPGRVTSPLAAGPHALLADGASLVRGAQDVLDALFGVGVQTVRRSGGGDRLAPEVRVLLAAIADGHDTGQAFSWAGLDPGDGVAALAALELAGHIRRRPGGRYSVVVQP